MLLNRSIFLQVCLLLSLTQCNCQDYGADDDKSNKKEDGYPDYSKFYSADTSGPLVSPQGNSESAGFLSPLDFSGFFGPSSVEFGAAAKQEVAQPKNPFAPQNEKEFPEFYASSLYPVDYFEEAQKQQRKENEEDDGFPSANGPSYISHDISPKLEGEFSSEVKTVDPKLSNDKKSKKNYEDVDKEGATESKKYKTPDYSYEYQPNYGKFADYNTGKSSSTVSQYPEAPGYFDTYAKTVTPSPYEKYSFQPVTENLRSKYLESLISTVAPFNPSYNKVAATPSSNFESQASENVPSHLKDKKCVRVKKHISGRDIETGHERRKREAMNCFVCENPSTNSKFTHCSYSVEPEAIKQYSGVSKRYSSNKAPDGFRYKRYSNDGKNDPYEFIKSRTQKAFDDSEKSTSQYDDYKVPDFYTSAEADTSYLQIQTEALAQNPANCHKEESKGMTCTICKDPTTGGNFEQCSYTAKPKAEKYAYVKEKKYDSNDEPSEHSAESKSVEQTKEAEKPKETSEKQEHKPSNENFKFEKSEPLQNYNFDNQQEKHETPQEFISSARSSQHLKPYNFNNQQEKHEIPQELISSAHSSQHLKPYNFNNQQEKHEIPQELISSAPSSHNNEESKKEEYNKPQSEPYKNIDRTPKKLVDDEPYNIPKHFAESTLKEQKTGGRGLEPSLYGSPDPLGNEESEESDAEKASPYKDIDEYHFRLFPEYAKQESQQAEVVANNPSAETTRKDVEEVLAEFTKKDRSSCKKAEKSGMTCYLCVDAKGIQHEECMYISESKPVASHVAYHEVKQMKAPENQNNNQQVEQKPAATEVKRELYNKLPSQPRPFSLEAAASEEIETKIRYTPPQKRRRNTKPKKVKQREPEYEQEHESEVESEPEPEPEHSATNYDAEKLSEAEPPKKQTPAEFIVGDEEGAFSAETKPIYSKSLGIKLPRYMIEKSEFEKEFDEFASKY